MYRDVDICLDTVQTRLCRFTTTLYFPSSPISLATPASLCSAQEPLLLSSLLLGTSLFNRQTTQALLAMPKLPQPWVHLILIAAMPAISCCSVTASHWEARPLVLAVLVRNGRGQVTNQGQGISGTLPIILAASATYRQGVGEGSYNLVTPAPSAS
jgi:hypothetical protein